MVGCTGHTRTRVLQCSLASVGLAQGRPNHKWDQSDPVSGQM